MTVIFFTKYNRAGASSRYRSYQYLPVLESAGVPFSASPLFDDAYLAHKYVHGRARFWDVVRAFARRLWVLLRVPRSAVVLIEYELLPWFPAIFERLLAWRGCRMVVDYDDALFHQYDAHPNPWVRRFLGRKIATVMRLAHTVVVGNAYLAEYAHSAGAFRVEFIPTVIDLVRYPVKDAACDSDQFIIGWIGSPSTAGYLREIAPALAVLCLDGRTRVRVVGSGPLELAGVAVDVVAWREETEVEEIRGFDVGVMPLPDEPWARGKCGFKLVQYMACGLPVVASPVGVNAEIVEEGVNGFLARDGAEWVAALERLKENAAFGKRLGKAGRRKVEERYCLQVTGARFAALLLAVLEAA